MNICLTKYFVKQLAELAVQKRVVIREIEKYAQSLQNLKDLYSPYSDVKVLKGYISSGKFQVAILLQVSKTFYISVYIARKESKFGQNMSKYMEEKLNPVIDRVIIVIEKGDFELLEFE